jgi:hypothetical protein
LFTQLENLRPNPCRGALEVEFASATAGSASLELLDLGGRRVLAAPLGVLAPGRYHRHIELSKGLGPGVYFMRFVSGARSSVRKVVLLP